MPNWCANSFTLRGSNEELQSIKHLLLIEDKFSFTCAVPQPENLFNDPLSSEKQKELDAQGIPNWYDWNIHNWGTKWDAWCEKGDVEEWDEHIHINFQTAWSPPTDWVYAFNEKLGDSKVRFELLYDEPGMEFAGAYVRDENGELLDYEGRIYNAVCGEEVFYDKEKECYVDAKGEPVDEDELTYEVDYGFDGQ